MKVLYDLQAYSFSAHGGVVRIFDETFQRLAREKIEKCGGTPPDVKPTTGTGTGTTTNVGTGTTTGSATDVGTGVSTQTGSGSGSDTGSAGSATITVGTGSGSGSAEKPVVRHGGNSNKVPWVLVATSVGFITVGAVLAYSASSSENDIDDLYQGLGGMAPSFDARTKAKYDDLVDEGERYEKLSWISFGLAGVTGIAAAVLFWKNSGKDESSVQVTPTASASGGGVSARWRF